MKFNLQKYMNEKSRRPRENNPEQYLALIMVINRTNHFCFQVIQALPELNDEGLLECIECLTTYMQVINVLERLIKLSLEEFSSLALCRANYAEVMKILRNRPND